MSGTTSCLRLRLRLPLALLLALPALTPLSQAPAQSYRDMAKEAALKGENEKAVQNYELALNSAMKLFDENDIEIVIRRGELGEAYRAVGRWKEAIEQLDYAWRRARYDAETKKRWTGKEGELTLGFAEKLGRACQAAGRYEDAVLAFQTSLSDAERAGLPPGTLITPSGLLADTLLLLKREEEADKAVTQALEAARKAHADEPPALARDLATLAQVYQGQLRYAKALPLAQEALALAEKNFPQESRDLGLYQSRVGSLMVLAGDDEAAAKALLEKGRENLLKKQTRDAVELLLVELSLAKLASRQGEFDLCQKHSGEAWRICKMHYPAEHPETGRCYRQLADNFVAMEMSEDAAGLYAKALAIFEDSLGKDHPLSTETRMILVKSETQLLAEKEQAMKEKAMAVAEERARMVAEEKTKAEAAEKLRLEEEEKARIAAAEKAKMEEEKAQLAMK
ncbi:MAG: tetratricopeptide repeat protein, partial [Verrucomicrobium sp.]